MTESANNILELKNVTIEGRPPYDTGLNDVTFTLHAGELALILLDSNQPLTPLADAAEGLIAPAQGQIFFEGEDWSARNTDSQIAARSRIGRVFEGTGWISNLDVDENITLSQRYHTDRNEAEIYEEGQTLAKAFGLEGLPHGRPISVPRHELRRAEWVRAFLGSPSLILLERPTRDLGREWISALIQKTSEAMRKGAAVVWTTRDEAEWSNIDITPVLKFKMQKTMMIPVTEKK